MSRWPIRPLKNRRDGGYTLVESMVVMLIISTLLTVAVPSFLGARARAEDAAAKVTLATAEKLVRQVGFVHGLLPANAGLLTLLPTLEPSFLWLDHMVSSTGPSEISIDEDQRGTELNLAVRSDSGACFYLRVVLDNPSSRGMDPGASDCEAHDYLGGQDTGWQPANEDGEAIDIAYELKAAAKESCLTKAEAVAVAHEARTQLGKSWQVVETQLSRTSADCYEVDVDIEWGTIGVWGIDL